MGTGERVESDDRGRGMVVAITSPLDCLTPTSVKDAELASSGRNMDVSKKNAETQDTREEQQSQSFQEDYFLNLAHSDVVPTELTEDVDRTERRRVGCIFLNCQCQICFLAQAQSCNAVPLVGSILAILS